MNCKIPFKKDIDFERKLYEITSISLEHEINIEGDVLKGNFIVSGDFKSHEVSVNKEAFSYILPFEIDLMDDIEKSTVEFMIEDFTYEIVGTTILRVNIDFSVIASKKEIAEEKEDVKLIDDNRDLEEDKTTEVLNIEKNNEEEERKSEKDVDELIEIMENRESNNKEMDSKKELREKPDEVVASPKDDKKEETVGRAIEDNTNIEIVETKEKTEIKKESEETIINSINGAGDEYTTYHIHMVSDGESVETICTMYNSNINILSEYNDLNNLASGDKLIIPSSNE